MNDQVGTSELCLKSLRFATLSSEHCFVSPPAAGRVLSRHARRDKAPETRAGSPSATFPLGRHESLVAEPPSRRVLQKLRLWSAGGEVIRSLSGKGYYVTHRRLKKRELESPASATKGQKRRDLQLSVRSSEGIPRWRDAGPNWRLMAVLTELKKQGAKRLHLNLSQEAQIEAQQRGIEPFRRRLARLLQTRLGTIPDFALALDDDAGHRVHIHGAIVVTPDTEPHIRRALRDAAGRWDGSVGNRRQLLLNSLDWPDRWRDYMTRNHRRLRHIAGPLQTWTRSVGATAERIWTELRWEL